MKLFLLLLPTLCFLSPCREAKAHSAKAAPKAQSFCAHVDLPDAPAASPLVEHGEIFSVVTSPSAEAALVSEPPAFPAVPARAKNFEFRSGLSPPHVLA